MSQQSLSRHTKTKSESPTAVEFGSRTPKSDHGSSENVYINYLSRPIYSYLSIVSVFVCVRACACMRALYDTNREREKK